MKMFGLFTVLVSMWYTEFLDSLVVMISACHADGRGSIPRQGDYVFLNSFFAIYLQARYLTSSST